MAKRGAKKQVWRPKSHHGMIYHGRKGTPLVHKAKSGKRYIMVRKKGGGTKRLYDGSKYKTNGMTKKLLL